ncbi:hypothetical protein JCM16358_22380 [Halanaerocella petrolearia]
MKLARRRIKLNDNLIKILGVVLIFFLSISSGLIVYRLLNKEDSKEEELAKFRDRLDRLVTVKRYQSNSQESIKQEQVKEIKQNYPVSNPFQIQLPKVKKEETIQPVKSSLPKFKLVGIIKKNNSQLAILQLANRTELVTVGGRLAGWQVEIIGERRILVTKDKQRVTLTIGGDSNYRW